MSSEAIRGHQRSSRGHQRPLEVIRGRDHLVPIIHSFLKQVGHIRALREGRVLDHKLVKEVEGILNLILGLDEAKHVGLDECTGISTAINGN